MLTRFSISFEYSFELYQLRKSGREREVKMIQDATEKAIKFIDYAFSYSYNFIITEHLHQRGNLGENAYNVATTSRHTRIPNEVIDEWREKHREACKQKCMWGNKSWDHFYLFDFLKPPPVEQ